MSALEVESAEAYVHVPKLARPEARLTLGETALSVWELGAICHEREAFGRFLRSARGPADGESYLRDSFAGLV